MFRNQWVRFTENIYIKYDGAILVLLKTAVCLFQRCCVLGYLSQPYDGISANSSWETQKDQ